MESIEATRLPEEIIHHIQSFLSGKEAARTTILSKSWYAAWLTRPNLDFSERDFPRRFRSDNPTGRSCRSESVTEFVKLAKKTIQRYDELSRKIQSFRLQMYDSSSFEPCKRSHASDLIAKAMNLGGVTNVDIELGWNLDFVLPDEVFRCQTIVKLSLACCEIGFKDRNSVRFSRLKSLSLRRVLIESGDVVWDIVSMCPLIEKLTLSGLVLYKCSHDFSDCNSYRTLALNDQFRNLKMLRLEEVEIGEWLFHDFSSRFPFLKDLSLRDCFGCEEIQICSNSLERVNIRHWTEKWRIYRVKFDVPRIRKFNFLFSGVPSLSFKTISREWESDITFRCRVDHSSTHSSFLVKIRDFLMELPSRSKIYLRIDMYMKKWSDYARDIIGLPKPPPKVDKLTLQINGPSSAHSAVLRDLFWSCRPTILTTDPFSLRLKRTNIDFIKLLYNTLIEEVSGKRSISALRDLEEVNVKFFEVNGLTEWQPPPNQTLFDVLVYSKAIQVCLELQWGEI